MPDDARVTGDSNWIRVMGLTIEENDDGVEISNVNIAF